MYLLSIYYCKTKHLHYLWSSLCLSQCEKTSHSPGQGFSTLGQVHHDTDLSYWTSKKLHRDSKWILGFSKVCPNHGKWNNIRLKIMVLWCFWWQYLIKWWRYFSVLHKHDRTSATNTSVLIVKSCIVLLNIYLDLAV